jgi:hypothetical protein
MSMPEYPELLAHHLTEAIEQLGSHVRAEALGIAATHGQDTRELPCANGNECG